MLIISGRYGTVVSYLRLMFWTPRPTLETSRAPSLRRPSRAGDVPPRPAAGFAPPTCALAVTPVNNAAAANLIPNQRKSRRPGVAGPFSPTRSSPLFSTTFFMIPLPSPSRPRRPRSLSLSPNTFQFRRWRLFRVLLIQCDSMGAETQSGMTIIENNCTFLQKFSARRAGKRRRG
jgi:hypothetical protein